MPTAEEKVRHTRQVGIVRWALYIEAVVEIQ